VKSHFLKLLFHDLFSIYFLMTLIALTPLSGEISRLLQSFSPLKSHPYFTIYCSRAFRSNQKL